MKLQKIRQIAAFLLCGSFFVVDRLFKALVLKFPEHTWYLWKPWLGWEYFQNTGVAFGLPLPWYFAFFYTPIFLLLIFFYYKKQNHPTMLSFLGLLFLCFGAISNLIDRIQYHITIDYFRIFTSIINVADIMIVLGALFFFFTEIKQNNSHSIHNSVKKL